MSMESLLNIYEKVGALNMVKYLSYFIFKYTDEISNIISYSILDNVNSVYPV